LWWSEPWRAWVDGVSMLGAMQALAEAPRGDGHGVLVIPGFLTDDSSTFVLRNALRAAGYDVRAWHLGHNLGPTIWAVKRAIMGLNRHYDETGRPVSLVGWSLGGLFARELARRYPDCVRSVITLGTPLQLSQDDCGLTSVGHLYKPLRPYHGDFLDTPGAAALPMPSTAVYSRTDGVVPWEACMQDVGPLSENVEVTASHLGMAWHPRTIAVVLDRLAQVEGEWEHYRAN
jgi:pimeloyl-ACP methyl ester carboxylesterase